MQSYLQWLQDSDYSPDCPLCDTPLAARETVRLVCYGGGGNPHFGGTGGMIGIGRGWGAPKPPLGAMGSLKTDCTGGGGVLKRRVWGVGELKIAFGGGVP